MNFMTNLFLIGAAGVEPAGRLSRDKRSRWFLLAGAITAAALAAVLLAPMGQKSFRGGERLAQVATPKAVRKTTTGAGAGAVAGLFYPKDPVQLSLMIDRLLAAAPVGPVGDLKAIVCPHAGYEFSGPVAAFSFKNLIGRHFDTVIILGPSHYVSFMGASVPAVDAYRTPLGLVPISPKPGRWQKSVPASASLAVR